MATTRRPSPELRSPGVARAVRVADAVVQGSLLAAVATLPLDYSLLTTTAWETDKTIVLIVLSILAGGAWLIGGLLGERARLSRGGQLLLALGMATYLTFALATLLSIDRSVSLFGAMGRHQGLVTYTAYLVFFVCAATRIRTRTALEQVITVILFAGIPAVVYGVGQQFGFDPIPSTGDPAVTQWPVRSTFGQHIFFGAYLVLVIPLTASRLLRLWESRSQPTVRGNGDEPLLAAGILVVTIGSFFGMMALAQHRGQLSVLFPALFAGYALFGVCFERLADTAGMRRVRLGGYGALLVLQLAALFFTGARGPQLGCVASIPVFIFLWSWRHRLQRVYWSTLGVAVVATLFVVMLNIPNGPLQRLRSVHGLNRISNIMASGGNESSAQGRLQIWHGVSTLITTHPAIGNAWGGPGRDLVGYGPDSMAFAFQKVYPLTLRQQTIEVYNWDRAHDIYLDIWVNAGLLGVVAFLGTAFLALAYILKNLRRWDTLSAVVGIGLASSIAGHLVEGIFGLETAVSLLLFWAIIGLSGRLPAEEEPVLQPAGSGTVAAWYWAGLAGVGTILALVSGLINHPALEASLWLAGICVGVMAIALLLIPVAEKESTVRTPRPVRAPVPTVVKLGLPLVGVGLALALVTQWQYETAAYADVLGSSNYGKGQFIAGLTQAQLAARAVGYEPSYRADLGNAYLSLARMSGSSAVPGLEASSADPRTLDPLTAVTLGRDQLFQLSVRSVNQAIDLAPMDPGLYGTLGDIFAQWKKPLPAYTAFMHAEGLSPNNPRFLDQAAIEQVSMGQKDAALHTGTRALALDPRFWYSHYALAVVYHARGEKAQARKEATQGLFWAPVAYPSPPKADLDLLKRYQTSG